jgi:hypothetical protein
MRRTAVLLATLALGLLVSAPAEALNSKSYVSSVGNDASDCATIATACRTFQRANNQTAAFGQIACVDSVHDNSVITTVTKSLTIDCAGTSASLLGIIVDTAGLIVVVRNLEIFGAVGDNGVSFYAGSTLVVENCVIRDNGSGIIFQPTGPGARLMVSNTLVASNAIGINGGGILIQPMTGGTADVVLDRVRVENNATGVYAAAPSGTGRIQLTLRNSTIGGNNFSGFYAFSEAPTITAVIDNSGISNNGGIGVLVQGTRSFVFVNRSTITGNSTGWTTDLGGNLVTYGTNSVHLNRTSNGAPTASIALQ